MLLEARRFHGKPLLQPDYNFRDVPWCARDLTGSTLSVVTERQHLVDSIAELTLLCNEATRRRRPGIDTPAKKITKPLSIEYIFDRIDTDDPIWALMVRTDTPTSLKGRSSNLKSSPHWKRGMLQGFIAMTTFTNWQSSFRFDSLHEIAFGQDDEELEEQMKNGLRKYDEHGSLAEELDATVKGGNPHLEGVVYPRIAEVSLFGGLGCGKQLLRLLVEHLECLKASALHNYDYIVLQATENSIAFYESMGFVRVGCVQGKAASPDEYHSSPVEEYHVKKNGETPASVAKEFGVDVWDIIFLNRPLYPDLVQKSWLYMRTKIFVPKVQLSNKVAGIASAKVAKKWHLARENETPRGIARKFRVEFGELLRANRRRYPDLVGNSKLIEGTRIQISRFDIDESDAVAYSHWTFPDADTDDNEPSYMMALKLNRRKGLGGKVRPVADSLSVQILPYSPEASGVMDLLLQPKLAKAHIAPIFKKCQPPKEPKKPKRPATSYGYFIADARARMSRELEGMSFDEINRVLSDKWNAMLDTDKAPYQERFEASRSAYNEAMKKYEADMERFQRESEAHHGMGVSQEVDTSLLEKVVKLKSTDGVSGASKFEYFYVLTFIPDLQWVHLIPLRKAGIFGPEHGNARGRPIWMVEDEGKEIDTHASVCRPVKALMMRQSADADNEQWDIYGNEEVPAPVPTSAVTINEPSARKRPKKPPTSFALFCADAKFVMKHQLENKPLAERTKLVADRWNAMAGEEKEKYKNQRAEAYEKYSKELKRYKEESEGFHNKNSAVNVPSAISSETPKSTPAFFKTPKSSKTKLLSTGNTVKAVVSLSETHKSVNARLPPTDETGSQERKQGRLKQHSTPDFDASDETSTLKRGRPMENPEPNVTPVPKRKRGRPRKELLPNNVSLIDTSSIKAVVQTVEKDPVALERLLEESKGNYSEQKESPVTSDTKSRKEQIQVEQGDNDVVLSLLDKKYRNIMWTHFKILGRAQHGGSGEKETSKEIFQLLKKGLRGGGRFLKKPPFSPELFEVDGAVALQKIYHDLKRRMDSSQRWLVDERENACLMLEEKPRVTRVCTKRGECEQQTSTALHESRPKLSPSQRPSRPEDPRIGYTPPKPASSLCQLAPIFLKKYGKKRKQTACVHHDSVGVQELNKDPKMGSRYPGRKRKQATAESVHHTGVQETNEAFKMGSRYPERKQKQTTPDSYVVSDDAVSATSIAVLGPRKKKARTGH